MAQCTAKKEPGNPNQDPVAYATAYDACTEIANFTVKKRNTKVALRVQSHVACLHIMFCYGRLAMPTVDVRM